MNKNRKVIWECVLLAQAILMREPVLDQKLIDQNDYLVSDMNVPLYEGDKFFGIGKTTGYLMTRGEKYETFCQYDSFDKKETVLNTFKCLAFESVGDKLETRSKYSKNSVFFPSITDRSETINIDKIIPIVGRINDFNMFVPNYAEDNYTFCPTYLPFVDSALPPIIRSHPYYQARETMYSYLTYAISKSNINLQKNAIELMQSKSFTKNDVKWLVDISTLDSNTFSFTK